MNEEIFDPNEEVAVARPGNKTPTVEETVLAVAKTARRCSAIGYTMQEARAVGLLDCPFVTRKERVQRWVAKWAMVLVGWIRRKRGLPVPLTEEKVTEQMCVAASLFRENAKLQPALPAWDEHWLKSDFKEDLLRALLPEPELGCANNSDTAEAFRKYSA